MTTAGAEADEFTTEVARTVTVAEAGIRVGAVYTPAELMVPSTVDPPNVPLTDHVTAVFGLPVTVAAKLCGINKGCDGSAAWPWAACLRRS